MQAFLVSLATLSPVLAASDANPRLAVERSETRIHSKGGHFTLSLDTKRGGELCEVQLFDGAKWNRVFAAPAATWPLFTVAGKEGTFALAADASAKVVDLVEAADKITIKIAATLRTADGKASPWKADLAYEVYPEGAVFLDLTCKLEGKEFALTGASAGFAVDEALRKAPKYLDKNVAIKHAGFRSARVSFGMNPERSFTSEVEAFVEHKRPMTGQVAQTQKDGRWTWTLGDGGATLKPGFTYHNRFALGLGAAETGKPESNCVGHRVYHWVNWLDKENWYPTNEQIDKMVANRGTMLILHHEYLLQRGTNGHPHADYRVARDHNEMVRCIDYAHKKGLRVGLYIRGVEPYCLDTGFWQKYCKRDWDGIYADWHGPAAVAWHDARYEAETRLGDKHFSEDGSHVPARAYFLFTKRLRETVGPGGFLIGHQGSFNSGILANLCFDAYLPGETGTDRRIFSSLDEAVYKGMLGGVVCMPWMLDLPKYRNAEGAAKMAAWGFYPHLVLGIRARHTKALTLSCDPDNPQYDFIDPYWRVLSAVDVEKLRVFNLPSVNVEAATSSDKNVRCLVYKAGRDTYLVIAANLGEKPAQATLKLDAKVLGLTGQYKVERIDAATGKATDAGKTSDSVTTSQLPQWGIEGFRLSR